MNISAIPTFFTVDEIQQLVLEFDRLKMSLLPIMCRVTSPNRPLTNGVFRNR